MAQGLPPCIAYFNNLNMHSMPSANHLDEVVVVALVLLVLPPVEVEHDQSQQEKTDDGDVDDVVYSRIIL